MPILALWAGGEEVGERHGNTPWHVGGKFQAILLRFDEFSLEPSPDRQSR